jgi:hypothetical protein
MTYTTLRDLTIEDYIKIIKIVDTFKDNDNRVREEFIKHFKLEKLNITELDETLLNINDILTQKPNFIQRFELDGVKYGFIPNLDTITAGEWIDIENYQSSAEFADRLVSILYRPIKRSLKFWKKDYYSIEEYKGTNDKLKKAPLEVYLGAMVFFYHLGKTLLSHIDTSIKTMSQKQKEEVLSLVQKHTSNKSLDGIV